MKEKKAFTLAEVLIALTIIGVIAAITVPALIQRTNKQEYVTALQKLYSVLSQATQMIIAEEGAPKGAEWCIQPEAMYNTYKKYLINAKDCGTGTDCFSQLKKMNYKALDGKLYDSNWNTRSDLYKVVLADGMQVSFHGGKTDCSNNNLGHDGTKNMCGRIAVDINGEKGPNQAGRDYFLFSIKENGLQPAGCDYDECSNGYGAACACRVIREGAMNY